jgi:hypothetical protein
MRWQHHRDDLARARNAKIWSSDETIREVASAIIRNVGIDLSMPGLAVTVAWSASALSSRWEPDPNWLDRAGRSIGLIWVVLMVFHPWLTTIILGGWSK